MPRAKKDDSEKNIKTSISIKPETYALLLKYSKKDERSVSWIADKAIRTRLEKRELLPFSLTVFK